MFKFLKSDKKVLVLFVINPFRNLQLRKCKLFPQTGWATIDEMKSCIEITTNFDGSTYYRSQGPINLLPTRSKFR